MKIQVQAFGEDLTIEALPGAKLLDYLNNASVAVNSSCGGKGTCFKCRVRVLKGFAAVTSADKKAFSENELQEGWRLSCQTIPRTNIGIQIPVVENVLSKPRLISYGIEVSQPYWACDLGSTGVVLALSDRKKGLAFEVHGLNRQIRYGADVMTRLHSSQEKGLVVLQHAIFDTLKSCVQVLREEVGSGLVNELLKQNLMCAGNSAMSSFLVGWDISSLAVSPFQPLKREPAVIEIDGSFKAETLPLLAGFVGGDTFAGLCYLWERPGPWMMIDIGTNTEIVLKKRNGDLWFCSAPAGPAFEGGNISSGMRAEPGAVCAAKWIEGKWKLETIGNDVARGICGSGIMDVLFESVRAGLIDDEGYLPGGRMVLTDGAKEQVVLMADDIREFQLAKSATRTACDIIIDRAKEKPQKLFLAGTFAAHLNLESVRGIDLIPSGIECEKIGNASLLGALKYANMTEKQRQHFARQVEDVRNPVELALQADFQDAFVRNLNFPKPPDLKPVG